MFNWVLNSCPLADSNIQTDECFASLTFLFIYNKLSICGVDSNKAFKMKRNVSEVIKCIYLNLEEILK